MVAPLVVAGGMALGSALLGMKGQADQNEANKELQEDAQAFNAEQAERQRNWEHSMSNTAYQRARTDMEAAGLNPLMMSSQGGASTPSGASASSPTPPQMRSELLQGLNSAIDAANTFSQINSLAADAHQKDTQAALNVKQSENVGIDTKVKGQSAKNMALQEEVLKAQVAGAKNSQFRSEKMNKVLKGLEPLIDRFTRSHSSAIDEAYGRGSDSLMEQAEQYLK